MLFLWNLRVVYFPVKHSCLYNKRHQNQNFRKLSWKGPSRKGSVPFDTSSIRLCQRGLGAGWFMLSSPKFKMAALTQISRWIDRFRCHPTKTKLETIQWNKHKKVKCYKRLKYKRFVKVSGLYGPQFPSYWPKRFMHLCRALHGDAILVYRFGPPIWPPGINKNIWSSLFLEKLFLFPRERTYVRINISSNTWNGYTAENQEERLFFNETAFLFWCHAL